MYKIIIGLLIGLWATNVAAQQGQAGSPWFTLTPLGQAWADQFRGVEQVDGYVWDFDGTTFTYGPPDDFHADPMHVCLDHPVEPPIPPPISPVPLPAAVWLFGTGLLALLVIARTRNPYRE